MSQSPKPETFREVMDELGWTVKGGLYTHPSAGQRYLHMGKNLVHRQRHEPTKEKGITELVRYEEEAETYARYDLLKDGFWHQVPYLNFAAGISELDSPLFTDDPPAKGLRDQREWYWPEDVLLETYRGRYEQLQRG